MVGLLDTFCFWTNKGGVGKSTLCFLSAISWAQMHPEHDVIMVDLDPQANLSTTLLTQAEAKWNDGTNRAEQDGRDAKKKLEECLPPERKVRDLFPRTILGFFMSLFNDATQHGDKLKPDEILVNVSDYNLNIPPNVRLLCGDRMLQAVEGSFLTAQTVSSFSTRPLGEPHPWVKLRSRLKGFLEESARPGKQTVIFIDTNPALTIFTEIALLSSTKLVVPMKADLFSIAALQDIIYYLHGVNRSQEEIFQPFEQEMFWYKCRTLKVKLPQITSIIFNQVEERKNEMTAAHKDFWKKQSEALWKLKNDVMATQGTDTPVKLEDVFDLQRYDRKGREFTSVPASADRMMELFGTHLTDLTTAGSVAMCCGLPLWAIYRNRKGVMSRMGMTSSAALSSGNSVEHLILQIIGRKDIMEGRKDRTILESLSRGRVKSTRREIDLLIEESDKSATQVWGKRKRLA